MLVGVVEHVELAEVLGLRAVVALGLHVDLPLAAEAVEVIDEGAAHEALHGLVNVLQLDALLSTLSRSTSTKTCGTEGKAVVNTLASSGRFRAAARNFCEVLGQESEALAGAVLQHERDPARSAHAGNGRRRKGEADGAGNLAEFPVQVRHDGRVLLLRLLALGPVLEARRRRSCCRCC